MICVDPALEHPNVTLLTNARVEPDVRAWTCVVCDARGEIVAVRPKPDASLQALREKLGL